MIDALNELLNDKFKKVMGQREEILGAFIAKYGCEPDEIMQIERTLCNGNIEWSLTRKITNKETTMEDKKNTLVNNAKQKMADNSNKIIMQTEKEELKLEVGKKYTNPTAASGCLIYLGSKNAYGFNDRSFNYIFIDSSGDVTVKTREQLEGIKEHREPYKISWDEYAYVCEKHLSAPSFSTYLTSPLCDCARKIFCEITIKEKEQNAN